MAECKLCKQKLSFRSLSTSDLKKHLQRIHPNAELLIGNNVSLSNYNKDTVEDFNINAVQSSFENTNCSLSAPDTEPEMPTSCWAIYNLKNKYMKHRIKTSAIWNFFNLEDKIAECKFCKKKLSVRTLSTSDLKKHLKRIHPTVEIPKVDINSQSQKRKIMEENLDNNPNQAMNVRLTDNSESIVTIESQTSPFSSLKGKITKTGSKTSIVWNYFTVENKVAVCNLCKHTFSYSNSSAFPNLRRHLIQRHSNVQLSKDVSNSEVTEDNLDNLVETPFINLISVDNSEKTVSTETGTTISSLELDLNHGFRKNRNKTSILWNYFTLKNETAVCNLCKKEISYRFWSLSNLKKHMLRKHPTIDLSNEVIITEVTEENFNDSSAETPFIDIVLMDNSENIIDAAPVSSVFCSASNLDHEYQKKLKTTTVELSKDFSISDVSENNLNDTCMEIPFINIILVDNSENSINSENTTSPSFSDEKIYDTCAKNKIRTSKVWSFYTLENEMAICKLCKMAYSYKSVSGLRKHLIRKHASDNLPEDINVLANGKSNFTESNINYDSESLVTIESDIPKSCVASALTHGKKKTGKKTSKVWNYFTYQDNKTALCNFCKMTFSYKSSISDLKKHLMRKHDTGELPKDASISVNMSEMKQKNVINDSGENPIFKGPLTNNSKNSIIGEPLLEPELNLDCGNHTEKSSNCLEKNVPLSAKKVIDDLVLDLFIYDFQPFTIVEDSVFQKSFEVLSPSYRLPNKKTFMNVLLPARYEECYNKQKKEFRGKNLSSVILTLDCWTSENKKSFLAVICNFVNENFRVESKLLECFSFSQSYSVSDLAVKLKSIAKGWGVENKIALCISDNASNTKLAVKEILKWNHLECYAHAINSIANDGLELHVNISSIIKKIKSVIEYFIMNADFMKVLLDCQEQLGYVPKELLNDVPLAWDSTFYMLERFVELEVPICSALAVADIEIPGLDPKEWKIAAELVKVLRPLEEITEIINGEDLMTASSAIIITKGMENAYKEMLDYSVLQETRELVETIALSIQCHLGDLENNDALLISTFLDPRFKTVGFSSASTAERAKTLVLNLLTSEFKLLESDQRQTEYIAGTGILAKERPSTIWNRFDKQVMQLKSPGVPHSQANLEIHCYLEEPLLNREEDPLKWWRENSQNYPLLKVLFLRKFTVLATTVPCERLLSKTNTTLSCDWRSRLSPDKVNELMFLNANDHQERSTILHYYLNNHTNLEG